VSRAATKLNAEEKKMGEKKMNSGSSHFLFHYSLFPTLLSKVLREGNARGY